MGPHVVPYAVNNSLKTVVKKNKKVFPKDALEYARHLEIDTT